MKKIFLIFFVLLFSLGRCTEEQVSEPECSAKITAYLNISVHDSYSVSFDVINTGDKVINRVDFVFTVTFTDGSTDTRTAYNPVVAAKPGNTVYGVVAMIIPQNESPINPKWIDFQGEITGFYIDTPEIVCR